MTRKLREYLLVMELTSPHGVFGSMRFRALGEDLDRWRKPSTLVLLNPREEPVRSLEVRLEGAAKSAHVWLEGVETREAADKLRGYFLAQKREEAEPLPEGRYYVCDLLGCEVVLENGDKVGVLRDILQNTNRDVYVVKRDGKKDVLFPLLDDTLQEVDIAGGCIVVRLPDGLLEVYDD